MNVRSNGGSDRPRLSVRTFRLVLCSVVVGCACANQSRAIPEQSTAPAGRSGDGGDADAGAPPAASGGVDAGSTRSPKVARMRITVGKAIFFATLSDNATARAFAAMLPLTLNMKDVNANEKYYEFPNSLPANASNPGTIESGDVMLYGSSGLVLFYKTFSTSYSYTRIGRIGDASGLATALGAGSVAVTFAP
jgi:hypothetical protein